MAKTLGLALGSGGARGIAHIGFLQVLEENNIPISSISGTSMGGIVGGLYCAGVPLKELSEKALKLKTMDIFDIEVLFFKRSGFIKGGKAEAIIKSFINEMSIEECKIPFACTAVDIMSGKEIVFDKGSLLKSLMATSAIPSVFAPVEIDGNRYVDGGVLDRLPIEPAKKMGADVIVAVDVLGEKLTSLEPKNIISTLIKIINIMDWEITKKKLKKADLVVTVEQDGVDQFMVKNLELSIEAGRKAGIKALPEIKELLEI